MLTCSSPIVIRQLRVGRGASFAALGSTCQPAAVMPAPSQTAGSLVHLRPPPLSSTQPAPRRSSVSTGHVRLTKCHDLIVESNLDVDSFPSS